MSAIAKYRGRIVALFRTLTNPAAGGGFIIDGVPIVPSTDGLGIIWTRLVTGVTGGALSFLQSVTQAILATFSADGALFVSGPGNWPVTHDPAPNTQATATKAGVAGKSHVCTSIAATLANTAAAATPILKVYLRDGASGVGAILWSANIIAAPNGVSNNIHLSGLNIVGTAGNAMTLEFSAAGGANTQENVSLTGYDV